MYIVKLKVLFKSNFNSLDSYSCRSKIKLKGKRN